MSLVVSVSTSPRRALLVLKLARILAAQVEDEGLVATGGWPTSACLRVARCIASFRLLLIHCRFSSVRAVWGSLALALATALSLAEYLVLLLAASARSGVEAVAAWSSVILASEMAGGSWLLFLGWRFFLRPPLSASTPRTSMFTGARFSEAADLEIGVGSARVAPDNLPTNHPGMPSAVGRPVVSHLLRSFRPFGDS